METRIFSNGYIGIKLNSVSEIMKYNALCANFSICNEREYYFDEYVKEDDGTGNVIEREPTESEKLERILQAFNYGDELYATFLLDCGEVVPNAATTLQTDFRIGQEVFTMRDNKIIKVKIHRLWLSEGRDVCRITDVLVADIMREMRNCVTTLSANDATINYIKNKIDGVSIKDGSMAYVANVEGNVKFSLVKLSELFATKEELVKHLMEEE